MTTASSVVLDSSALLAYFQNERGAETVSRQLDQSTMSSVNWSEVVQKGLFGSMTIERLREDVEALGVTILPFTGEDAEQAALLWNRTKRWGLSLADRACLALALRLGVPVVTSDRAWSAVQTGIAVHVIR